MDRQEQVQYLVDHFKTPRHKGPLDAADVSISGGNPGCGDVVTIHLKAAPDEDRVTAIRFEGCGCTISQAAASILLERMNRRQPTFDEIQAFSYEDMMEVLGKEVVASRVQCATLALGTLQAALRRLAMDRQLKAAGHSDEAIKELRRALERRDRSAFTYTDETDDP